MTAEFWETVDTIRAADERYSRDAYAFVVESLESAVMVAGRPGHVSGAQLVKGLIQLARKRMGVMAWTVLEQWGIVGPSDVGEIVFQLIDAGVLSRREEDSREDFDIEVDFGSILESSYFEDPAT